VRKFVDFHLFSRCIHWEILAKILPSSSVSFTLTLQKSDIVIQARSKEKAVRNRTIQLGYYYSQKCKIIPSDTVFTERVVRPTKSAFIFILLKSMNCKRRGKLPHDHMNWYLVLELTCVPICRKQPPGYVRFEQTTKRRFVCNVFNKTFKHCFQYTQLGT